MVGAGTPPGQARRAGSAGHRQRPRAGPRPAGSLQGTVTALAATPMQGVAVLSVNRLRGPGTSTVSSGSRGRADAAGVPASHAVT